MKTICIILSLTLVISLTPSFADFDSRDNIRAIPEVIWDIHEVILDGTIIDSNNKTWSYDIQVNQVFKGPIKSKLISAEGFDVWNNFTKGDRALFYIYDISPVSVNYKYKVTDYSVKTNAICDARSLIQISPILPNDPNKIVRGHPTIPANWNDPCVPSYFEYDPDFFNFREPTPPKMQLRHSIPMDLLRCYDDKILIFKIDDSPACVKPETKLKLMERGWTKDSIIIASAENKKVNLQDPTVPKTSDGLIDYHELIIQVSKPLFVDLFVEKGITVNQDDIKLMRGPWILIYTDYSSACGYTIVNDTVYWLQSDIKQDTLTKASIMTENPDPCKPSYDSCFCMAEYQMTEETVTELSYFDKSQEAYVGRIFLDYLNQGGKIVNMPKRFVVGNHNFEMKPDEQTFCGAFVSDKTMNFGPDRVIRDGVVAFRYFSGVIKENQVISFSLEEPMKLCAISSDARVYDFVG